MTESSNMPGSRPGSGSDPDPITDAAQDWFLRRTTGTLAPAEQVEFRAWCEADPRHLAAYEEVSALWADLEGLEHVFAPGGHQPVQLPPPQRARRPWLLWAPAVSGLAAAALFFAFVPTLSHLPQRLMADHSTPVGEQRRVALPDGSVALLNTDSAIDVAYSDGRRVVTLLYGEAWFDVKKDPLRPFDVVAVGGRTTAVGTAFVVRDHDAAATVTVTAGVVRVTSPDTAAPATSAGPVVLEAGQQTSYRRGGPPEVAKQVDASDVAAWRHGAIAIRDRPLVEALAEIGRYRGGRIVLAGNASRYLPVTARLSLADIDGGINALAATHGLTVTRVTDFLVIVR